MDSDGLDVHSEVVLEVNFELVCEEKQIVVRMLVFHP